MIRHPSAALWRYVATLVRMLRWKVALAFGVSTCLALTEGVGLLMLVPLLELAGLDVRHGPTGWITKGLTAVFATVGARPTLISVLSVYVLVIGVHGLLARWQTTLTFALEHEFVASLRTRLYRAIAGARWPFFARSRSADFAHALTAEMERVGEGTHCLLLSVVATLVTLVYVGFALTLSVPMTALACASGVGLMLALRRRTRLAQAAGEAISRATNSLYAAMAEHLGGMKVAKSHGAEERHSAHFAELARRVRRVHVRAVENEAATRHWGEIGSVLLLSASLYVAVGILALPTAEILLLLFLFARLMPKISNVQQGYQSLMALLPAFASVMELRARCEAAAEPRPARRGSIELRHAIGFDRVSFGYAGRPVIRELDLLVRAGRTTAVVGPSGSGKSTVADLVTGLVTPDRGRVLVDGVPLGPERMAAWREGIGYVTQDTFLFNDTVRANLLWADSEATEGAIRQALRRAGAEEFVGRLPRGLDTLVGDRGVLLSGGERQRLALARALLRRPSLLILDEATSALDSESEQRILEAIEGLRGGMTILVMSHRLSAVRWADLICVLEDGRLVESGTWGSLMGDGHGRFRSLFDAQRVEPSGAEARV